MAQIMRRAFGRQRQQEPQNGRPSSDDLRAVTVVVQGASPYVRPPREESGWVAVPWPFPPEEEDKEEVSSLPGDDQAEVLMLPDMQWHWDGRMQLPNTAFSCETLASLEPPPHVEWWDAVAKQALRPGRRLMLKQLSLRAANGLAHVLKTVGADLHTMELPGWTWTSRLAGFLCHAFLASPHLKVLDLNSSKFGRGAIVRLCQGFHLLPELEVLNLNNSVYQSDHFPHLARGLAYLVSLKELHLKSLPITPANTEFHTALRQLTCLRVLNLESTHLSSDDLSISPAVMCSLARAIQPPMMLQRLNVRGAAVDAANDWRQVLEALPALEELNLSSTIVEPPDRARALSQKLAHVRHLNLARSISSTAYRASLRGMLEPLDRLESLDLSECSLGGRVDLLLDAFRNFHQLLVLHLSRNDFAISAMTTLLRALPQVPSITDLDLAGNNLWSHEYSVLHAAFAGLRNLQRLNISRCFDPHSSGHIGGILNALASLPNFTSLDISHAVVSYQHALSSLGALTNLRTLEASDFCNTAYAAEVAVQQIQRLTNLTALSLSSTHYRARTYSAIQSAFRYLQGLTVLETLNFAMAEYTNYAPLFSVPNLIDLVFRRNTAGDVDGAAVLQAGLQLLPHIAWLPGASSIFAARLSGITALPNLRDRPALVQHMHNVQLCGSVRLPMRRLLALCRSSRDQEQLDMLLRHEARRTGLRADPRILVDAFRLTRNWACPHETSRPTPEVAEMLSLSNPIMLAEDYGSIMQQTSLCGLFLRHLPSGHACPPTVMLFCPANHEGSVMDADLRAALFLYPTANVVAVDVASSSANTQAWADFRSKWRVANVRFCATRPDADQTWTTVWHTLCTASSHSQLDVPGTYVIARAALANLGYELRQQGLLPLTHMTAIVERLEPFAGLDMAAFLADMHNWGAIYWVDDLYIVLDLEIVTAELLQAHQMLQKDPSESVSFDPAQLRALLSAYATPKREQVLQLMCRLAMLVELPDARWVLPSALHSCQRPLRASPPQTFSLPKLLAPVFIANILRQLVKWPIDALETYSDAIVVRQGQAEGRVQYDYGLQALAFSTCGNCSSWLCFELLQCLNRALHDLLGPARQFSHTVDAHELHSEMGSYLKNPAAITPAAAAAMWRATMHLHSTQTGGAPLILPLRLGDSSYALFYMCDRWPSVHPIAAAQCSDHSALSTLWGLMLQILAVASIHQVVDGSTYSATQMQQDAADMSRVLGALSATGVESGCFRGCLVHGAPRLPCRNFVRTSRWVVQHLEGTCTTADARCHCEACNLGATTTRSWVRFSTTAKCTPTGFSQPVFLTPPLNLLVPSVMYGPPPAESDVWPRHPEWQCAPIVGHTQLETALADACTMRLDSQTAQGLVEYEFDGTIVQPRADGPTLLTYEATALTAAAVWVKLSDELSS